MTSGTFSYGPAASDLVLNAFARLQLRRAELTAQHLADAATEVNLLQVEFSNRQPLWWTLETNSNTLTASTATYNLPARTVAIVAAYIETTSGGTTTGRIITPISTVDYASLPNKASTGYPTSFWLDRQATPQVTLWPVPDSATTYTLKTKLLCQPEDASLPQGVTPDVPYRWLDAWTAALAARLAAIWRPELEDKRKMDAERAFELAARQDQEDVPLAIAPQLGAYYH